MKQYLDQNQIDELIRKSLDPVWQRGALAVVAGNWYDLWSVSPTRLIYFKGNSDTGWQHIQERHSYSSEVNYFGNGSLGNPSKFKTKSIPIYDYRNIADDLFLYGLKDNSEHPNGNLFDKYKGKSKNYIDSNGDEVLFHLVLYKGTKIVHSLYPDKSLDPKPKRILKEYACSTKDITANLSFSDGYHNIHIPYIDKHNRVRYVVIFRINPDDYRADFHLQINSKMGKPLFTTYLPFFDFSMGLTDADFISDNFIKVLNGVSQMDLTLFDIEILKMDKHLNPI